LERVVLSWSGGKDSCMALERLLRSGNYRVISLLTTITKDYDRISMHGVRRELLEAQSKSLGLQLDLVYISKNAKNEEYEEKMKEKMQAYKARGIRKVAFGDIFLREIREYRESRMNQLGMRCLFPLWGIDTSKLAKEFISQGFRAVICTVDPSKLSKDFAGSEFSTESLAKLPRNVDPCGERGEFHTFVYDGPLFANRIEFSLGEVLLRDNFYFADLVPGGSTSASGSP
jgi:uncharacterized protein (TIGR00290 family)